MVVIKDEEYKKRLEENKEDYLSGALTLNEFVEKIETANTDPITICEECGCKIDIGMRAFLDGSHIVCGVCSDKFQCFLLMCEYVGCDTDSQRSKEIKKFLDGRFKKL